MKVLLKRTLTLGPMWRLATAAIRPRGVTVLMYHRITDPVYGFSGTTPTDFATQMTWLKSHCRPIAPEELDDAALGIAGPPPVLVTFDDGYRDYHDHAYPVLSRLGITGLVFLATRSIDDGVMIWTDAVAYALHRSRGKTIRLPWQHEGVYMLSDDASRRVAATAAKRFLKDVTDVERQHWLKELYNLLGVDPDDGSAGRQMLDWHEVRNTLEFTRYGGHTHNHPILSRLPDAIAEEEIRVCRDRIRDETGFTPRYFAYPNGRAQDFTDTTKALLRKYGFERAFSTIGGLHRADDDVLAIRRQPTGGSFLGDFAMTVAGR